MKKIVSEENMKKKFSIIVCTILCAVFSALCLSGCGFFDDGKTDLGTTSEGYKYTYINGGIGVDEGGIGYMLVEDGGKKEFKIAYPTFYDTTLPLKHILTEIDGLPVTCVESLGGMHYVKEIVIPEGITKINGGAFMYNEALESISLPDSLITLGSAFPYCKSLKSLTIPKNVTWLGNSICNGLKALQSVSFPGSIKKVPQQSCQDCVSLTSVTLGEGIETIGERAFCFCTHLESITLPDSLNVIEKEAFKYCFKLKSITFPEKVQEVGELAFHDCGALESITINNKTMKMGKNVFLECPNIKIITFNGTQAEWQAFEEANSGTTRSVTIRCTDGDIVKK